MDEDALAIGKKRRASDPAVALAEEAVRMQREIVVELRKKAATRIGKDDAAKNTTDKKEATPPDKANSSAADGTKHNQAKKSPRTVPKIPDPNSTLDVKA